MPVKNPSYSHEPCIFVYQKEILEHADRLMSSLSSEIISEKNRASQSSLVSIYSSICIRRNQLIRQDGKMDDGQNDEQLLLELCSVVKNRNLDYFEEWFDGYFDNFADIILEEVSIPLFLDLFSCRKLFFENHNPQSDIQNLQAEKDIKYKGHMSSILNTFYMLCGVLDVVCENNISSQLEHIDNFKRSFKRIADTQQSCFEITLQGLAKQPKLSYIFAISMARLKTTSLHVLTSLDRPTIRFLEKSALCLQTAIEADDDFLQTDSFQGLVFLCDTFFRKIKLNYSTYCDIYMSINKKLSELRSEFKKVARNVCDLECELKELTREVELAQKTKGDVISVLDRSQFLYSKLIKSITRTHQHFSQNIQRELVYLNTRVKLEKDQNIKDRYMELIQILFPDNEKYCKIVQCKGCVDTQITYSRHMLSSVLKEYQCKLNTLLLHQLNGFETLIYRVTDSSSVILSSYQPQISEAIMDKIKSILLFSEKSSDNVKIYLHNHPFVT